LIRGVHERWHRDLGCGVKQRAGAGSKDAGASSTDVSASEHDEDEETEQGTRKRNVAGGVKGKGRARVG